MKLYTILNGQLCISDADPHFTDSCDILVVGAGAGGIFSSVTAAEEGADVILAENDTNVGGMRVRGNVTPYYYGAPGGSFEKTDADIKNMKGFGFIHNQPEPRQVKFTELIRSFVFFTPRSLSL